MVSSNVRLVIENCLEHYYIKSISEVTLGKLVWANVQHSLSIQIPEGFLNPLSCYSSATFQKTSANMLSVIFFRIMSFKCFSELCFSVTWSDRNAKMVQEVISSLYYQFCTWASSSQVTSCLHHLEFKWRKDLVLFVLIGFSFSSTKRDRHFLLLIWQIF